MAKKLRVWIDRDQCIADQVCAALCPQVFEMADDGLSSIVAQYRKDPNNLAEGIVPIELKDCVAQAVDSCPVQIIHMEEIEE
ncbi:MAG: ferredoxin [Thermoplasmata archaeon]|nr:MAG: ferredoxin [Thermoplasmata archaeon]HDJ27050.1 ferredoxin [Aciduliprofundum sp.]